MPFPKHIVNGSLCYIIHDERVLLLRRANPPHPDLWSAPGGKMELGESPQDAVVRELQEETGLHIHNPALRAIQTSVDLHYPVHWMLYIFVATEYSGTLGATDEGLLQWHPFDEVTQLQRPYPDTVFWQHVINGKPGIWQGKFVYDTPKNLVEEAIYS